MYVYIEQRPVNASVSQQSPQIYASKYWILFSLYNVVFEIDTLAYEKVCHFFLLADKIFTYTRRRLEHLPGTRGTHALIKTTIFF